MIPWIQNSSKLQKYECQNCKYKEKILVNKFKTAMASTNSDKNIQFLVWGLKKSFQQVQCLLMEKWVVGHNLQHNKEIVSKQELCLCHALYLSVSFMTVTWNLAFNLSSDLYGTLWKLINKFCIVKKTWTLLTDIV